MSPAIVLDVMKILEKEIGLREETRSTQTMKDAVDVTEFLKRAKSLATTQQEIADMNRATLKAITDLEEAKGLSFPTEKGMLRSVGTVMQEVQGLLEDGQMGPPTIAAETQIIELLLKVQRKQPPKKKSKGGGGSQPGSGGEGDTEESALALIGRGAEAQAQRVERTTEQTSGAVTAGYPAEYRSGLDIYFSELEKVD